MCDAVYGGVALLLLLAVGTVVRVIAGRSPNAELITMLYSETGTSQPEPRAGTKYEDEAAEHMAPA